MPYCPNCRVEYVEGVIECSDCGVPLVETLPPLSDDANEALDEMAVLAEGRGDVDTRLIVAELEAAGIPYVLAGDEVGAVMIYPAKDAKILVSKHYLARAQEVLSYAVDPGDPNEVEAEAAGSESADAGEAGQTEIFFCDHCGAEVPPNSTKCPECGEPFENP